jgi:hypothetical protein
MDPESFRLNLNSLLESLRSVTLLLQSQKSEFADFDSWYLPARDSMKTDPIMKWSLEARNRVVHQADLEIYSKAVVRLSRDWLNEIESVLKVPPHYTTHQTISALFADAPQPLEGIVSIERRWVDVELPNRELLEATRHSYNRIAGVVQVAHKVTGMEKCDLATRKPDCVDSQLRIPLQCMHQIDENRRLVVDLTTMTQYTEEMEILRSGDIPKEVTDAKYGRMAVSGNAIERVPQATEMAKKMLSVDKELAIVAWLLRGDQTVEIFAVPMPDQRSKLIQMHRVADLVEQSNADGVIFISESWLSLAPTEPTGRRKAEPSAAPQNRGECISVCAVTRDGKSAEMITIFTRRKNDEIIFEPSISVEDGQINNLQPIVRRWQQISARPFMAKKPPKGQ